MTAWAPPALRVVTVGDDRRFHAYLEAVLRQGGSYELAEAFESGPELLSKLEEARWAGEALPWDLVLVDLETAERPCLWAIKRELPGASVVAITSFDDPPAVDEAIQAGADAWVAKYTPADRLLGGLGAALSGAPPPPPEEEHPRPRLRRAPRDPDDPDAPSLTARERAVLHCLVQGMSYKATARRLHISVDTVRSHIRSLYAKLGVHTVGEAVACAVRGQLV
ncbi:MAG TPA: response regulator transcription factor [Longimicrobiaceae bacterium]|nr:response regulator transcription factor [Longimicrobiaceae bacterium]